MSYWGNAEAYQKLGSQNRTAIKRTSKTGGREYFEVSFSDKDTKRAYTVKVFAYSVYVPKDSKKSYRNGNECCPVIVQASRYNGSGSYGGSGNRYNGGSSNNKSWS